MFFIPNKEEFRKKFQNLKGIQILGSFLFPNKWKMLTKRVTIVKFEELPYKYSDMCSGFVE